MSGLLGFFLDQKQFIGKKEAGWLEFKDSRIITGESRIAMLTSRKFASAHATASRIHLLRTGDSIKDLFDILDIANKIRSFNTLIQ